MQRNAIRPLTTLVFSGVIITLLLVGLGCGGRTSYINTNDLPDTYQCEYMEYICNEAAEFEHTYSTLSGDEQDESKVILQTYRNQCQQAVDACKQSAQ
ncbi:hypothetical protein QA601_05960 [Chitinispirillales bacterium ANBcel5]|uniref:hypothetical protein n=1 Tax=Cellulosispirillum alkaliphilum TaxID=3039283 RepID=UPI002A4E46F9|nr:hypothetical protein [Chitinispirillales bacterium ANBcel5]